MCIQVCMHVFSQIVFYAWGSNLFPVGVGINFGAPKWPLPGRCPAVARRLPDRLPGGCLAVARLVARWLPGWLPGGCCWGLCWVKEMHVFLCVPLPLGSVRTGAQFHFLRDRPQRHHGDARGVHHGVGVLRHIAVVPEMPW